MSKERITILDNEEYLRQISAKVDFRDKSYLEDIKDLEEYCRNNVVWAMAAVQIGVPKRIIYIKSTTDDVSKLSDPNYNEEKVLINPIITQRKGHTRFLEACASALDNSGVVDRPYSIVVEYYNVNGELCKETVNGFEATVLSHEYDHLNGVLHIDLIDESDVIQLDVEQRKKYREEHPYEIISETCDYEEIRIKKLKRQKFV